MEEYGFCVSDKRRAVWNAELELFCAFRDICDRHNLMYYAEGGTLLGAVRHKGFIPWDDDLDISMPREDYEKFLIVAKEELSGDFYLQIPERENDYFYGHAKIRKNHSTAIRYVQYPERYLHHQGVFIDIFPLDNIPDNAIWHKIHKYVSIKLLQIIYYAKYYYRVNEHALITRVKHRIGQMLLPTNKSLYRFYRMYEWWIRLPNKKESRKVGTISIFYYLEENNSWLREWFDNPQSLDFESTKIRVPGEYDKVLRQSFGDYMTPVIAPSQHGDVYFDLSNDYRAYYDGSLTFSKEDCIL